MPDFSNAGDIFRSRILGMGLEDTPYQQQAVGGMLGGATPEQLQSFFASPEVQKQFQSFGINPQQFTQNIRQSPYLPNSFMQHHPMMGGMLSRAMANAESVPDAPLVSGAGSGISRALRGIHGGGEELRQYQLSQMMAPFGMLAAQMPTYGEQRRRAIEEAIVKETQARQQMLPWQRQQQEEQLDIKSQLAQIQALREQDERTRSQAALNKSQEPHVTPYGVSYPGGGYTTQEMPGLPAELGGVITPGGPGRFEPFSQDAINSYLAMHPNITSQAALRNAMVEAGLPDAQADEASAKAWEARQKGNAAAHGGDKKDYSKDYETLQTKIQPQIQALERMLASGTDEKGNKLSNDQKAVIKSQIDTLNQSWEQGKADIDQQRGDPGASRRQYQYKPQYPQVAPPQSTPSGAQAGGPGSQTSEGTATAPPPQVAPPAQPQQKPW